MVTIVPRGNTVIETDKLIRLIEDSDNMEKGCVFAYLHGMLDARRCFEEEEKERNKADT